MRPRHRAVAMGKRGFKRIEMLSDEREAVDPRQERLASSALDKHDTIVRRNLGSSDNEGGRGSLNLNPLGRPPAMIAIEDNLPDRHSKVKGEALTSLGL